MGNESGLRDNRAAANGCTSSGVSNRRGVSGVWVAICIVPLLGIAALAIDAGYLYVMRNRLQATADAAALAGAGQWPDLPGNVEPAALEYAGKNMPIPEHGTVLLPPDVVQGNWETDPRRIFTAGGNPTNAVQVTTRKAVANGNPVDLFFASVMGFNQTDVSATAIAVMSQGGGGGSRFLIDSEVMDNGIPAIEDMAAGLGITSDQLLGDANNDWFVDFWDYCHTLPQPDGCILELPTGQLADEGLFDMTHPAFPFTSSSDPSFMDFLNWNEDAASWRYDTLGPGFASLLDPLLGVSVVDNPDEYPYKYIDPDLVHVSPLYKSDTSALNPVPDETGGDIPNVNALGRRRGLVHFKIIGVGEDPDGPGGSALPNLIFEFVDPSIYIGCFDGDAGTPCTNPVQPWSFGAGAPGLRLVF